eukprot:13015016-Alexandrium_andersonii.AAC.1
MGQDVALQRLAARGLRFGVSAFRRSARQSFSASAFRCQRFSVSVLRAALHLRFGVPSAFCASVVFFVLAWLRVGIR